MIDADTDRDIHFYFDPVCPFAWMTSKWIRLVQAQRDYTVDWRFISLRMINADVDYESHFPPAPYTNEGGSFVIFSGVAAAKIAVGTMAVAITNGAADILAKSLALELAPLRVNAISPGVIDTVAWEAFGERGNAEHFAGISARNPVGRIGAVNDIAQGVLFAMINVPDRANLAHRRWRTARMRRSSWQAC